MKKILIILVAFAFMLPSIKNTISDIPKIFCSFDFFDTASANNDTSKKIKTTKAKIVKIVDGDTLSVKIKGKTKKVRLIGVDTPESVNPDVTKNTKQGVSASKYTKQILKKGDTVYLQKDKTNTDVYGRLLRYVWIKQPMSINKKTIKQKMLNGILVYQGYAYAKAYAPNTKYKKLFSSLEKSAEKNKSGILWK